MYDSLKLKKSIICVLDKDEVLAIYVNEDVVKDLINYRGHKSVSYLTVEDNKLYVGNFRLCTNGIMKIYDIYFHG